MRIINIKFNKMTRYRLLEILKEETDSFTEQSRLRDDVIDAMKRGVSEALNLPIVGVRSEQLFCKCGKPSKYTYIFEVINKKIHVCEEHRAK